MTPNYKQLLRQSWTYLARYRIFWVLGVLEAIGTGLNNLPGINTKLSDIGSCLWLVCIFLADIIGLIAGPGIVRATAQLARTGQPPSLGVAWQTGRAKFWQFFLLVIIYLLLLLPVLLLAQLLPVPNEARTLCLLVLVGLTAPVIEAATCALVLDDLAATSAFASGWRFFRTYWSASVGIIGITLTLSLLQRGLLLGLTALPGMLFADSGDLGTRLGVGGLVVVAGILIATPLETLQSILWTLFYRDRRPLPPLDPSPGMSDPLSGVETRRLDVPWRPADETQALP